MLNETLATTPSSLPPPAASWRFAARVPEGVKHTVGTLFLLGTDHAALGVKMRAGREVYALVGDGSTDAALGAPTSIQEGERSRGAARHMP